MSDSIKESLIYRTTKRQADNLENVKHLLQIGDEFELYSIRIIPAVNVLFFWYEYRFKLKEDVDLAK